MTTQEEVLDAIRRMSVADLADLVRAIADDLETSDRHAMTTGESEEGLVSAGRGYDGGVSLRDLGDNPIEIIRTVREITDLGLHRARELLPSAPAVVAHGDDGGGDGPEAAGVPAKPKRPSPTGRAAARLVVGRPGSRKNEVADEITSQHAGGRLLAGTGSVGRRTEQATDQTAVYATGRMVLSPCDNVAATEVG